MLKSTGLVSVHQPQLLGVYRLVDSYNDRPVYKQDMGENYIYYRSDIIIIIHYHEQYLMFRQARNGM